jgi:hypothetical protein
MTTSIPVKLTKTQYEYLHLLINKIDTMRTYMFFVG